TPVSGLSDAGSMRFSGAGAYYIVSDHWAAILDSIADLKAHFDREEDIRLVTTLPEASRYQDASNDGLGSRDMKHALLLYGCPRPNSGADILTSLPPRPVVDRYISRFFSRVDLVATSAAHGPTFLREYEMFWTDPEGTPIMWLGLLFSMMCLALLASDSSDASPGVETYQQQTHQIGLYRLRVVQCLVLGEYTNPSPYVLETMHNYVYIEFIMRSDAYEDIWFLHGLTVSLARRMGYHRDPRHFPHISPLQGEMRRRLWSTVLLSDILISGQMGMPCMICDEQYDTTEPRNLNDADLNDDTKELPAGRPETEITTTLGLIARRRLLTVLSTISTLTAAVKPHSYKETLRIDAALNEAEASLPQPLRMRSMAASVMDTAQTIISRIFLRHLYYKGQIMLHRGYLFLQSELSPPDTIAIEPYAYSRQICVNASLGCLELQDILDKEACPGGQLHTMRWRVTSILNHHFLTATMILCSLLYRRQTLGREEDILAALRRSRMIWMRRSAISCEAKKAAETVSIVLARAGEGRGAIFGSSEEQVVPDFLPLSVAMGDDSVSPFGIEHISSYMDGPSGGTYFVTTYHSPTNEAPYILLTAFQLTYGHLMPGKSPHFLDMLLNLLESSLTATNLYLVGFNNIEW
ncbi:hypothetical protein M406DRAFT_245254, partial [Cryphonectria parasitica EP155]